MRQSPTFSSEVYVTMHEILRLSSRHNRNGHYIHAMTHRDYVSSVVRHFLLMCPKISGGIYYDFVYIIAREMHLSSILKL